MKIKARSSCVCKTLLQTIVLLTTVTKSFQYVFVGCMLEWAACLSYKTHVLLSVKTEKQQQKLPLRRAMQHYKQIAAFLDQQWVGCTSLYINDDCETGCANVPKDNSFRTYCIKHIWEENEQTSACELIMVPRARLSDIWLQLTRQHERNLYRSVNKKHKDTITGSHRLIFVIIHHICYERSKAHA